MKKLYNNYSKLRQGINYKAFVWVTNYYSEKWTWHNISEMIS